MFLLHALEMPLLDPNSFTMQCKEYHSGGQTLTYNDFSVVATKLIRFQNTVFNVKNLFLEAPVIQFHNVVFQQPEAMVLKLLTKID